MPASRSPVQEFALMAAVVGLAATACSGWDSPVPGGIAVSGNPRTAADVDRTGLVPWQTVGVDEGDVATGASAADAGTSGGDTAAETGGAGDVLAVEFLGSDASEADTAPPADGDDAETPADGGDAGTPADGGDAGLTVDAFAEVSDPCSGADRPLGCGCAASQDCASGLCVYGPGGLVCSASCKNVICPAGWSCTAPALVCMPQADAGGASDAADAAVADGPEADAGVSDDGATLDGTAADAPKADAPKADAPKPDAPDGIDASPSDSGTVSDAAADATADAVTDATAGDGGTDALVVDAAGDSDGSGADAAFDGTDNGGTDAIVVDAAGDAAGSDGIVDVAGTDVPDGGADVDTDGLTGLDWVGYPDAIYPDDADIFGGAINSCLSLYLFQQETCGKNNPSAACIDSVATQGSLYANFLFEPVRLCQDTYCVDLCAAATEETCMNQCIGKNCPNQFLACVSNNQHGNENCQTTFSCAMSYPGKLLTIGSKCYANGTLSAQLAVGGLISCETKPNTDSCFQAVGDCYDQGATATNTCMQTITCTQGCGGDQNCVWLCLGKASPAGRAKVDALGDCMVTVCGPKCGDDKTCSDACLGTDCAAQFGACVAN